MKCGVLLNGVPASGKSTLGRALMQDTQWPLFAVDTVKEALFDEIGAGDRIYNRRLGRAGFAAIFALLAGFPSGTVMVDAWYGFQPAEFVTGHIARAGFDRVVEVWCHAPPAIVGERYRARVGRRAAGHPGIEYVPELVALAERARPLGLYRLIEVDMTAMPEAAKVAATIRASLAA